MPRELFADTVIFVTFDDDFIPARKLYDVEVEDVEESKLMVAGVAFDTHIFMLFDVVPSVFLTETPMELFP
jgi:hypothetical protein